MVVSKAELAAGARQITGSNVSDMSLEQIYKAMTISQYVTDLCLREIEDRGKLTFFEGSPVVPYYGEHVVKTILTRPRATDEETSGFVA